MIDWREFFGQTLANENSMRAAAVRSKDKKHAVMVHTVPLPYFNFMNTYLPVIWTGLETV